MKLYYYTPDDDKINFGDELNAYLWKYFFGENFFDENTDKVFSGIGTIIKASQKNYPNSELIFFGSGCHQPNYQIKNKHKIYFVRGENSANALKIDPKYALTDPALLVSEIYKKSLFKEEKRYSFGYIPHFSVDNETYKKVVEDLGFLYITPNSKPLDVIRKIHSCNVIISEAMHGAIISDTYNIPWIPINTYKSFNKFKWNDWSKTIGINVEYNTNFRLYETDRGIKRFLKSFYFKIKLKKISRKKPYLSSDIVKNELKKRLLNKINQFKLDYNIKK